MKILHVMRSPSSRFEAPRGGRIHAALKPLSVATGRPLRWKRLRWFKKDFELRAGDDSVGRLSFCSMWSYLATAISADGDWAFKRTGFWRPEIRVASAEVPIAVFRYKTWEYGGWLEFHDGRRFRITDRRWAKRFEVLSSRDEVLVSLRASAWTEGSAEVELGPEAAKFTELSLLLLFGWYLAVLTREEAAGA